MATILFCSCDQKPDVTAKAEPVAEESSNIITLDSRACYFDDVEVIKKIIKVVTEKPATKEIEEVQTILNYIGLPQNFVIYRGNVPNAMATMYKNSRLIVYNKDMFTTLDADSAKFWSSMFIMAHEIGHHLAYNISDTTNSLTAELQADIFAASVLYKMGADSLQTLAAVKSSFISNSKDTKTHPAKWKRIRAVSDSWLLASELRYTAAVPPNPGSWAGMDPYTEDMLYTGVVDSTFAYMDTLKKNGYICENMEGIVLDVANWDRQALTATQDETELRVLVTKTGKNEDADGFGQLNERIEVRVDFHGTIYMLKFFKEFLIPGQRIRFNLAHVRAGIFYIVRIEGI